MRYNLENRWSSSAKQKITDRKKPRPCNLCAERFTPRTVFDRFCPTCKNENELLKFSDWLPEVDQSVEEKISA